MVDVNVIESTLVIPCEETPRGQLWLSNLDQVMPSNYYASNVYFYKNMNNVTCTNFFSVHVIKAALAKALVLFYSLAGRVMVGSDGRKMIDCNGQGALLVVARLERSSDEIDFQPSPDPSTNQFVPTATSSEPLLLMLQVTYLKCGGVVLGAANNHVLVDGRGAVHFLQTWAQLARGDLNSVVPPSFDNALLHARSPPSITFTHSEYGSERDQVKNKMTPADSYVITKKKFSKEQICSLKSRCIGGDHTSTTVSTFCAISALFWKSYCIAQEIPPGTEMQLNFTADVRKRLQPPLPENFFGNAVIRTSAIAEASAVASSPIYVVANTVKAAINGITDEYVRSFIDYVEVNRDKNLIPVKGMPKSNLRITNITGMPVYDADFGWGEPQIRTWAQIHSINAIYMMNEPENNAVVMVLVVLDSDTMPKFEKAFHEEMCLHQS